MLAPLATERTSALKECGFTGCDKTQSETRQVSGHDFSRANNANKLSRASAPAKLHRDIDVRRGTTSVVPSRALKSTRALAPAPLFSISLLVLLFLTGCKPVGPNYNRPVFTAPPTYKESGATAVIVPPPQPRRRRLAARQPLRWNAQGKIVGKLPGSPAQCA